MLTVVKSILCSSVITQIMCAMILGVVIGHFFPEAAAWLSIFGKLFISALKAIAPVLVLVLVMAALSNQQAGTSTHMRPVIALYLLGTLAASVVGVIASMLFPSTLYLQGTADVSHAPKEVSQVMLDLLMKVVDNPVNALQTANYVGVLAWAIALGLGFRHAAASTRQMIQDAADTVTSLIQRLIRIAPLGILGLVASTFAEAGVGGLLSYAHVLAVLLGAMLFVALVVNPLIVGLAIRTNPYPLVFTCLRESAVTAFFTRSSAANIPVNLALAERLKLDRDTYSIAIPLGATINMAGAAITISVLSLAAAHTLGITVAVPTAILLCVVAALCACGASGVAGGSLLLIPLACSLFGVSNDVVMQVVMVGMLIGIVQDSAETALNSSTDVLFTAAACKRAERLAKKA
ncbi:MAG: serine/threonine transporter SstT [Comamonas sp.]